MRATPAATLAETVRREGKAQKIAAHLVAGIQRQMDKNLLRRAQLRGPANGAAVR